MMSDLPKVCHPVGGRPMVCAVVDACLRAGCDRIVVVVGYKQELVREALAEYGSKVEFAVQAEQLGTGHAVMSAADAYPEAMRAGTDLFVLCGDGPLIRPERWKRCSNGTAKAAPAATLATSVLDDPAGYGRIERDRTASSRASWSRRTPRPTQLARSARSTPATTASAPSTVRRAHPSHQQRASGEYYITDVFELLLRAAGRSRWSMPCRPRTC
jgi:bifunctional UDP-N-acetylglucosamine pyrophosphorylase/glucosamine-1-phosphate N-acetyltransferase